MTIHTCDAVVVGSGAAGFNAADRLHAFGRQDIAIVTEGRNTGTSRNTGSDKQTYYKLSLSGGDADSVREMAETLYSGGAMHGDIALVEAALSARCFYRLVEAGVPFPHDRYGGYAGYKTDHDPRRRATSAGPLTSRFMTECLEEEVRRRKIPVFDGFQVIAILTDPERTRAYGLMTLDLDHCDDPERRFVLFSAPNIIYSTGGPAGMYGSSVYPPGQTGSTGVALEAGARAANLTESQFGIGSTGFRWNLSGSYQQVLPRYISTDADGGDEREFLDAFYAEPGAMLDAVFLKGYQWPFDVRKLGGGSSLIDLIIYHEHIVRGRRVFLDFTRNPRCADCSGALDTGLLGDEAREYLERSGALDGTPVDRLLAMNRPAYDLYLSNGIDLAHDRLEIGVCNQHANGGLVGDIWWESNLSGFFPVGEVNGSHGVYRPGGSALNAGQVGGMRAAQCIVSRDTSQPLAPEELMKAAGAVIEDKIALATGFLTETGATHTVAEIRDAIGNRMDTCGGIVRAADTAHQGSDQALTQLRGLADETCLASPSELGEAFRNHDLLLAQAVWLASIADYIEEGGGSRGSFIVHDPDGVIPSDKLPDMFRYRAFDEVFNRRVQYAAYNAGSTDLRWEDVRPIPEDDAWFETVWRDFRSGEVFK